MKSKKKFAIQINPLEDGGLYRQIKAACNNFNNIIYDKIPEPDLLNAIIKLEAANEELRSLMKLKETHDQMITGLKEHYGDELKGLQHFIVQNTPVITEHLKETSVYSKKITDEQSKQNVLGTKLESVKQSIKQKQESVLLAEKRIKDCEPYEKFIREYIDQEPYYRDIFDIIKKVDGMTFLRKKADDDIKKTEKTIFSEEFRVKRFNRKQKVIYPTASNYKASLPGNQNSSRLNEKFDLAILEAKKIKDYKEKENLIVFGSIFQMYRLIYIKENGKLPNFLPKPEDQLTYIFEAYKLKVKILEACKEIESRQAAKTKKMIVYKHPKNKASVKKGLKTPQGR